MPHFCRVVPPSDVSTNTISGTPLLPPPGSFVWAYFWVPFSSIPHQQLSLTVCSYVTVCFEIGWIEPSHFIPLFKNWLSDPIPSSFCVQFSIASSVPINCLSGTQVRTGLNVHISVEWTGIFTTFCLPIHEHGTSVHLNLLFFSSELGSFSTQILYMFC